MRKSYDEARSSETHRGDRKRPSLPEEVLRRSEKEKERSRAKNAHRVPIERVRFCVCCACVRATVRRSEANFVKANDNTVNEQRLVSIGGRGRGRGRCRRSPRVFAERRPRGLWSPLSSEFPRGVCVSTRSDRCSHCVISHRFRVAVSRQNTFDTTRTPLSARSVCAFLCRTKTPDTCSSARAFTSMHVLFKQIRPRIGRTCSGLGLNVSLDVN